MSTKVTHSKTKPAPRYRVADARKIDDSVFIYDSHSAIYQTLNLKGRDKYRITHDIPRIPARLAVARHIARQLNTNWEENSIAAMTLSRT